MEGNKLTPAQRQLAEDNYKLIYSFMHEYKIDEEFYGDLALKYCACLRYYDASKCALSTYVYKCLYNKWLTLLKKKYSACRYLPIENQRWLEYSIGDGIYAYDIIGFEDKGFEDVEEKQLATEIREYLRKHYPHDKNTEGVFDYILQGYSCQEVSEIYGVSRQAINARFNKLKKIYKEVKEEW